MIKTKKNMHLTPRQLAKAAWHKYLKEANVVYDDLAEYLLGENYEKMTQKEREQYCDQFAKLSASIFWVKPLREAKHFYKALTTGVK